MTSSQPRVPWQAKYLALVLLWGSSFLIMMIALRAFTPFQIVTVRILLGAATLVGLLAATRGSLPRDLRVWLHLLVCGFFLAAFPFTMFVWSETRIPSALAGIANATTPIATVLAILVLMPGERSGPRKIAAVLIGFAGVVLIAQPWNLAERPDPLGFVAALLGGMSYGIGWTYNRRHLAHADLGGLSQPTALMACGALLILPVGVVTWWLGREVQPLPWSPLPVASGHDVTLGTVCMIVLAVVSTGIAYTLQYDVVRGAGPLIGSTITYLIPIVSVVLGVAVLGEHLTWLQLVGFAVVLVAAVLVNTNPRERGPAEPEVIEAMD